MSADSVTPAADVARGSAEPSRVPLAVDVDGTLVRTDLLHEALLQHVAHRPLEIPRLLLSLGGGKAGFKSHLADRAAPDFASLPLREETLALIRAAQAEGRPVYLVSASDHRYIAALAERIGGLAGAFGSSRECNLAGANKARLLNENFGPGGYDYVGDRPVDLAVWRDARRRFVVAAQSAFERRVIAEFPDAEVIARPRSHPRRYLKALRPHQWAKNLLVFLSIIAGHYFNPEMFAATLVAFVCFCAAASSAYIINDLLDLPGDRQHPTKCRRPFAAGDIPVSQGVVLSAVLLAGSIGLALLLPGKFLIILLLYVATTLAYSLVLKRKMVIDVITLGGLYSARVYAGLAASGAKQSEWLLMFSLFLFLSLALVKRCSELVMLREEGKDGIVGRGYRVADLAVLFPAACAAGYGAILVVALYMASPEVAVLYRHPARLWLLYPLLLYWITRVILLSGRNELHDDPVVFALTDRVSWAVGALCVGVIVLAI
ncbi:MAG: UbiA family prenyltransferase [Sphingomonadales bacterium]|nr:UbiA family prenyltransferase [Sphingomonadales bacterium]MBU3993626.1 UbiA family prenyltransferase [Alphaproteobacteria bacterium]